jgi:hypothetical protein
MSRPLIAVLLLLVLGSCGTRDYRAPAELDNACAIVTERPHYASAFRRTEQRWGVEPHVLMAIIHQESKFIANNRPPRRFFLGIIPRGRASSAYGYAQALDGTWDDYKSDAGRRFARRDNVNDATDFIGWYMNRTRSVNGISLDDAYNQYLAYHEGHAGYRRGTYRNKSWLLTVAANVRNRAATYERQLASCRGVRL